MHIRATLAAVLLLPLVAVGVFAGSAEAAPTTTVDVSVSLTSSRATEQHPYVDGTVSASIAGDYELSWSLVRPDGSRPLRGGGVERSVQIGTEGAPVRFDLGNVVTGRYRIEVTLSRKDPDLGRVTGRSEPRDAKIRVVWPQTPATVSLSGNRIYPARDGYRDDVTIRVRSAMAEHGDLELVDSRGRSIWHRRMPLGSGTTGPTAELVWRGRTADGALAPAGRYQRVVVEDAAGIRRTVRGPWLTVSRQRLVRHTFERTVSASASITERSVGDCSRVSTPSSHGWAGSMGLESNVSCDRTDADGLVVTGHDIRVPAAPSYGDVTITTDGGAAAAAPRSILHMDFWSAVGHHWGSADPTLPSAVGRHRIHLDGVARFLSHDHRFRWAAYVGDGDRYDVRSFTIRITYRKLG